MPDVGISSVTGARPSFLVDEKPAPELAGGLFGLTIHKQTGGLYRCEALFGNWGPKDGVTGFLYFDRATLDFGRRFKVRLGDATLFDGRITALEARFPEATPPQIVVLAEDRLQDLRMTRRTRSFADMSDSDLFSTVAGEHGLTAQTDIAGPTHKVLAQVNQSDLALLRDRARGGGGNLDRGPHAPCRIAQRPAPARGADRDERPAAGILGDRRPRHPAQRRHRVRLGHGGQAGAVLRRRRQHHVLVAFEGGDARWPYVVGMLWNGSDKPPETMDGTGKNNSKVIRSRNGVKVTLDDQDGQENLVIETPGGQRITLKDGPGSVEIVDANGNSVKLEAAGIAVTASAKVTVNASLVAVSASLVTVDAGMSRFSGVVQADTVIANSVISASYTPGAGNIW